MDPFETVLTVCVGIGLAAAAGFRVFVPLLVTSLAAHAGMLELSPGFAWIGSTPAIFAFAAATLIEVGAYYLPVIDNLLDTIASPLAVVAGTVLAAAVISDLDPLLKWSLAIIAGGGTAAVVQANTVAARLTSSATTGGVANPVVSTAELGGSTGVALLSVLAPVVVVVVLAAAAVVWTRRFRRRAFHLRSQQRLGLQQPQSRHARHPYPSSRGNAPRRLPARTVCAGPSRSASAATI